MGICINNCYKACLSIQITEWSSLLAGNKGNASCFLHQSCVCGTLMGCVLPNSNLGGCKQLGRRAGKQLCPFKEVKAEKGNKVDWVRRREPKSHLFMEVNL